MVSYFSILAKRCGLVVMQRTLYNMVEKEFKSGRNFEQSAFSNAGQKPLEYRADSNVMELGR